MRWDEGLGPERLQLTAWLLLAEILPDSTRGIHLVVAAHSVATSWGITAGLTLVAAGTTELR